MKITVFTSNQPRHIHLINQLATISDKVYAVQECNTVFPGQVKDFFNNSIVMQDYFSKVIVAEKNVFGDIGFSANNVANLSIKSGDLNSVKMNILSQALDSDYYIVFGASFIKGDLIKFLVDRKAINIHMGISPYYRGSSCNFWALNDRNIHYVGATIHMLSKGLDSGEMLYHALPMVDTYEPFDLGMYAVKSAHESLVEKIKLGTLNTYVPVKQDKSLEIRYTRNSDFNDAIAQQYLQDPPTVNEIYENLKNRDLSLFLNPYIPQK